MTLVGAAVMTAPPAGLRDVWVEPEPGGFASMST
jgi:hypothetical protein